MPRTTNPATLIRMIESLRNERAKLQQRIDEIDEVFGSIGTASGGGGVGGGGAVRRGPGRPPGSGNARKTGGRRKRGSFAISGEESVFQFVKSNGKPNAAEINRHWQKEGRGGKADNTLTRLVKEGRLKRLQVKGERGGRYRAV